MAPSVKPAPNPKHILHTVESDKDLVEGTMQELRREILHVAFFCIRSLVEDNNSSMVLQLDS